MKLKSRQDLFALLLGLVYPSSDLVDIEVYMKESDMPQMVMAVATKKLIKAALKEETGEDGEFLANVLLHFIVGKMYSSYFE